MALSENSTSHSFCRHFFWVPRTCRATFFLSPFLSPLFWQKKNKNTETYDDSTDERERENKNQIVHTHTRTHKHIHIYTHTHTFMADCHVTGLVGRTRGVRSASKLPLKPRRTDSCAHFVKPISPRSAAYDPEKQVDEESAQIRFLTSGKGSVSVHRNTSLYARMRTFFSCALHA